MSRWYNVPMSSAPSGLVFDFVSLGIYTLEIIVVDVGCLGVPDHVVQGQQLHEVPHVQSRCHVAEISVEF